MLDYNTIQNMIESASSLLGTLFYAMVQQKIAGNDSAFIVMIIAVVCLLLGAFLCFFGSPAPSPGQ